MSDGKKRGRPRRYDEKRPNVTVRLAPDLMDVLRKEAEASRRSLSDVGATMIESFVASSAAGKVADCTRGGHQRAARPVLQFRVHETLYERIKESAKERNVSISEACELLILAGVQASRQDELCRALEALLSRCARASNSKAVRAKRFVPAGRALLRAKGFN